MPLHGVYEQRSTTDSLAIDLERVYTQLATTGSTVRDQLTRELLDSFDAAAYLAQHTGTHLLPRDLRTMVEPVFPDAITGEIEYDTLPTR
jgi:hypothetical protein